MLSDNIMSSNKNIIPSFLIRPHLPSGKVTDIILGTKYANLFDKYLNKKGIKAHLLADFHRFSGVLSSHSDMLCCHLGGNLIVFADILSNNSLINELEFNAIQAKSKFMADYPHNIGLNLVILGDLLMHNLKYTDGTVVKLTENKKKINVKQGYSKCSVCTIDENSIITDDIGIAKAAEINQIDALIIEKGFIELEGFNYGFIGGAAFKPDAETVAFTGKINDKLIANKIFNFIESKNLKYEFMTDLPIFDVGSIIPIKEIAGEG